MLHYVDARLASVEAEIATRSRLLQEEIDRRLAEINRAMETARTEMNRRLEGMNEFRAAMSDMTGQMLTKDAYQASISAEKDRADIIHRAQGDRLDKIEARLDMLAGQAAGAASQRTEARLSAGQWIAIIAVLLTAAGIAVGAVIATGH